MSGAGRSSPRGSRTSAWPAELPAVQFRFARPTEKLGEVVAFYTELLGLPELGRGDGAGFEVVMVGLPGAANHLEFVAHADGIPGDAPTAENLLVFYFKGEGERDAVAERLRAAGVEETALDNPWWAENGGSAFLDPDEWQIVLMPKTVLGLGDDLVSNAT